MVWGTWKMLKLKNLEKVSSPVLVHIRLIRSSSCLWAKSSYICRCFVKALITVDNLWSSSASLQFYTDRMSLLHSGSRVSLVWLVTLPLMLLISLAIPSIQWLAGIPSSQKWEITNLTTRYRIMYISWHVITMKIVRCFLSRVCPLLYTYIDKLNT